MAYCTFSQTNTQNLSLHWRHNCHHSHCPYSEGTIAITKLNQWGAAQPGRWPWTCTRSCLQSRGLLSAMDHGASVAGAQGHHTTLCRMAAGAKASWRLLDLILLFFPSRIASGKTVFSYQYCSAFVCMASLGNLVNLLSLVSSSSHDIDLKVSWIHVTSSLRLLNKLLEILNPTHFLLFWWSSWTEDELVSFVLNMEARKRI